MLALDYEFAKGTWPDPLTVLFRWAKFVFAFFYIGSPCVYFWLTSFQFLALISEEMFKVSHTSTFRPLAGNGLPPLRGSLVDHIFLEAQFLARILQHVSPLTMAALSCNSLLHTLPYEIFAYYILFKTSEKPKR